MTAAESTRRRQFAKIRDLKNGSNKLQCYKRELFAGGAKELKKLADTVIIATLSSQVLLTKVNAVVPTTAYVTSNRTRACSGVNGTKKTSRFNSTSVTKILLVHEVNKCN